MSTSSRREFIATAAAASLLPLVSVTAKPIPTPQPVPGTIPLWLVEHPAEQAWEAIDGHYPSRLLAEQYVLKYGRSKKRTIRQVACPSSGRVFRLVGFQWARYEDAIDTLACHKTNHKRTPLAEFHERLRDVVAATGLPEARVLKDLEAYMADQGDFTPRAPRHLLDLPDVLLIGTTEQAAEAHHYTDRATAIRRAAEWTRELNEAGKVPEEWNCVGRLASRSRMLGSLG